MRDQHERPQDVGIVKKKLSTDRNLLPNRVWPSSLKRVYFAPPRTRILCESKSALLILLDCSGSGSLVRLPGRLGETSGSRDIPARHHLGRPFFRSIGESTCRGPRGLIFAAFLFEPYGRNVVYRAVDRIVLLSFAFASIPVACLSRNSDSTPE